MVDLIPKTISLLLVITVSIKILFTQIVDIPDNKIKSISIFILTLIGITIIFYICYCLPFILLAMGHIIIIVCLAYAIVSVFLYLSQY